MAASLAIPTMLFALCGGGNREQRQGYAAVIASVRTVRSRLDDVVFA